MTQDARHLYEREGFRNMKINWQSLAWGMGAVAFQIGTLSYIISFWGP